MYLYNSVSHKKELFVPNNPDIVKMYTCGPTVYHYAHIGNLRTYIMEDVLEKALRYVGYNVKRVMNITDVGHLASDADTGEDKMLKGAKRENKTVMEIAQYYTDAFFADCEKLNIKKPDVIEPATNCIDEYIHMVQTLLEQGKAYFVGGNVYFDTSPWKSIMCSTTTMKRTWPPASGKAWKRTPTRKTRMTSFCGLPRASLKTRPSSGILPGALVTPAGISSAPAFP